MDSTTALLTLPEDLQELAKSFSIPSEFIEKSPDIIVLILRSQSLNSHEEKQNWFNLLPLMNDQQLAKLVGILTKEQEKLKEIEQKYDQKKSDIEKKYIQQRDDAGYLDTTKAIKQQEQTTKQQEEAEADALLQNL
jgi:hypothetical protein